MLKDLQDKKTEAARRLAEAESDMMA